VYVPGKIKIDRLEESFGNELSAALTVANSPDVVVPARTMIAPAGGVVLDAARDPSGCTRRKRAKEIYSLSIVGQFLLRIDFMPLVSN
jgi:hypothetical protein